jgi:quercetin dioxygenase-like cupin family protein
VRTTSAFPLLLSIGLLTASIAVAPSSTLFENDQVKVIRALEKPHAKGGFHEHKTNRVMIYLQAGRQRFEYQDGRKPAMFTYKAGEVKWSPPEGMHSPEALNDDPFNIIEVELKKPGTGKKITTKLDPVKIDPKHYKVELENDQVRVIRAHMGPHESVPLHEHTLNRVTVFLTDQNVLSTTSDGKSQTGQHKAGEAIWSPPQTHKEQNLSDQPFEVVAVEIKD